MTDKKTAIIIGAGPAGLTAAYELLKQTDYKVIILEETDEIGGISRTINYKGNRIDIGGHRFFSKNEKVMNWWLSMLPLQGFPSKDDKLINRKKELSPAGPDPEITDRVMLSRERVSRIYYLRKFFDYPINLKLQTLINMGFLRTLKAGFSYMSSLVFKRKEESLEDFFINRFGKALYSMFFEDYTEKVWGVHPSKISKEWGAQRIKGVSLSKAVTDFIIKSFQGKSSKQQIKVETSLIEQFFYPKYGPGQLWEAVCDEVIKMGGEVLKRSKVTKINSDNDKVNLIIYEFEGKEYSIKGDVFLSSMPICDLVKGLSGVNVPERISTTAQGLPYRDFITVGLLVNRLCIKNETNIKTVGNIVPDCWIYIQEQDVKIGRLQIFNNWSPYMVKDLENSIWIGLEYFCNEGDKLWEMENSDFIKFAKNELQKIGIVDAADVMDSVCIKVKKAYPAYFGTYKDFEIIKTYLNKFTNLYCIGRNGQHRYNNMDHSMLTAFEAVNSIIDKSYNKENVWSVNSEEEYHEVQKITDSCTKHNSEQVHFEHSKV